jgi:hypothetical protein
MFQVDFSKFKPVPSFRQDGFDTYVVGISAVGIENDLYLLCAGNNPDEAAEGAMETVAMLKHNDMEVKRVIKIEEK